MKIYPIGVVIFLLLALSLLLFSTSGCKKDPAIKDLETTLSLEFSLTSKGKIIQLNEPMTLAQGYGMEHLLFKFYLDNLILTDASSVETRLADVILMDWRNAVDGKVSFSFAVKPNAYQKLSAGVGLDSARNSTNPNSVPIDHPLSSAQGTHWDAWTNYRFIMLEGELDTLNNTPQTFQMPVIVHTGFNYLYRKTSFDNLNLNIAEGQAALLKFEVNLDKLYLGTDFKVNNISHTMGNEALALLITDNFLQALKVK